MRKGRSVGGLALLILGFIFLVIFWSSYTSLVAYASSDLGILTQAFNSTLASQIRIDEGGYLIGIIVSGIIAIIGIVLIIVGIKDEPKKIPQAFPADNSPVDDNTIKEPTKRSHLARNAGIIVIVVVVIFAGMFIAYSYGLLGSSSSISQNSSPLSIVVNSTIDDQPDASQGNLVYVYYVNITDKSTNKQYSIDPLDIELVTNTNTVYNSAFIFYWGDDSELSSVTLGPGLNVKGNVAFEFPTGQTPSYLQYDFSGLTGKITNLPSVSEWVSEISTYGNVTIQGTTNLTASSELDISSLAEEFVTGTPIPFEISITNWAYYNITVTSVSVTTSGFSILNENPSAPFAAHYEYLFSPQPTNLYMNLTAPSYCFQGTVTFLIDASD